jgi:SAM-dependent methyltransferase
VPEQNHNEQLREEFNRWAAAGRGEGMENDHLPIALPMLAKMGPRADENILDVGCGGGWLCKLLSSRVTEGRVVGMDISDEMVRHARRNCADIANTMFVVGSVDAIPWQPNFFTRVVSVESSYYWPDPAQGLREIFRVLGDGGSAQPGGQAWLLINYYRDNPHCHQWGEKLAIPANLLSADEWAAMFRDAGFTDVAHEFVPDPTPTPDVYKGRWFRDAAQLKAFREMGALLVKGVKP